MPFLQITRQTSYKKGHKKLFCRVLTSTPRMKHVLLGKIFTLRGALGSIRSRLVTQRFSQVSWGGALRDETKTASKETTRYANTDGKLLILRVVDSTSWRSFELNHTRHAIPRCAVKRSINWTNPATAGDPNSVVLKMFERNQFRVNSFTLTIFQL